MKNITDYGVFIDLGGIDGLLHVTDLSWGRVNHPSEMFNVGDEITVKVLKYDREKERVSLGYKQLQPDPWTLVPDQYPLGARVTGKVVNLTDYGAFIELEAGSRRTDSRFRDVVEQAREASVQDASARPGRRSRRAGCGHGEPPHFAGSQADRSRIRGRRWPSATRSVR